MSQRAEISPLVRSGITLPSYAAISLNFSTGSSKGRGDLDAGDHRAEGKLHLMSCGRSAGQAPSAIPKIRCSITHDGVPTI